jgi:O-antigen ligase
MRYSCGRQRRAWNLRELAPGLSRVFGTDGADPDALLIGRRKAELEGNTHTVDERIRSGAPAAGGEPDGMRSTLSPWSPRPAAGSRLASALSLADARPVFRLKSVQWNALYIGFLVYMFTIITYFIQIGTIAMIVALVGLLLSSKPLRVPPYLVLFAVYIAWASVGLATSEHAAIVQDRVVDYAKLWLIALVAVNALRTKAQLQAYLILVAAWYLLFPARGTIRNFIVGYSPAGRAVWNYVYKNPNDLAALTLLALGVALALFLSEGDRRIRLAALLSSMTFAAVVLMTQSRGALVALAMFALLAVRGQRKKLRGLLILAVCGSVVIAVAPSNVWERARGLVFVTDLDRLSLVDEERSAEQRWEIWKVATNIISDHPIRGVGLGAYPEAHHVYSFRRGNPIAFGKRDTHSTYLNVAAETGFPGLGIFLLMFVVLFARAERVRRSIRKASPFEADRIWFLQLGLGSYLIAGIWGSFPQMAFLHVFAATLAAASYISAPRGEAAASPRSRQPARLSRCPAGTRPSAKHGQDTGL